MNRHYLHLSYFTHDRYHVFFFHQTSRHHLLLFVSCISYIPQNRSIFSVSFIFLNIHQNFYLSRFLSHTCCLSSSHVHIKTDDSLSSHKKTISSVEQHTCSRSLVKAWEQASAGRPLSPTMSYLSEKFTRKLKWDNSVDGIVKGFKRVASG